MNAKPPLPADLHALRDAIVELLTTAGAVSETAWDAPAGCHGHQQRIGQERR